MAIYEIAIRLMLAVIIGGAIGYERETSNRPAGFRTHMLVAIGAAIVSLIQVQMVNESITFLQGNEVIANAMKIDMGRMGAQVISGIGFLGAGTIIHEKGSVKGLTSAASLWVVGCLGLAIGLGYYTVSILGTIAVVLILVALKKFEKRFISSNGLIKIYVEYKNKNQMIYFMEEYLNSIGVGIKSLEFAISDINNAIKNKNIDSCLFIIRIPKFFDINDLLLKCAENENIIRVCELKD